ncbi:hypothetical protein LTR66_002831 [Elasticomyces elasticus]|nr:hypothetical protein LTR28_013755 [Elasticomyces elasticus]KAK4997810.1 hypothetical protein LTR66_002831 [Elasticomyces elasticus]
MEPLESDLPVRGKTPKQQLSKGMEHMRFAVTVLPSPPTTPAPPQSTTGTDPMLDPSSSSQNTIYGVPQGFEPLRKPVSDSSSNAQKRTDPFQFGSRYLEAGDDIFAYNAWDHVEIDDAYKAFIEAQTDLQRNAPVSEFDKQRFNNKPEKWWDKFYSNNQANFFKDRKWLVQEFPILGEVTKEGAGQVRILEVGAGAGNTAFPILEANRNEDLTIHACDYSKKAVEVMRAHEKYNERQMKSDVWDVAGTGEGELPPGVEKESVDIVIMIFVFSALEPRQWAQAMCNVWNVLKPGGHVLFRDYGRGDLAQVRFKKSRYLEENFYVRGDGTRVYFFEKEELEDIWRGHDAQAAASQDLPENEDVELHGESVSTSQHGENSVPLPLFEIIDLGVDRRMLVNRQRKLKMYRCWLQGLFRKPLISSPKEP